jgi:1,4-dihydroxy-2-naphthoate octaprenyltransferase
MNPDRRALLIVLISAPLAIGLVRKVLAGTSGRSLNPLLKQTAQLLLLFGLLTSAGAIIGRAN